jgi:hypothetical protein
MTDWCHRQQHFCYISAVIFIGWGIQEYPNKTTDSPQVTDKLHHNVVLNTPHHEYICFVLMSKFNVLNAQTGKQNVSVIFNKIRETVFVLVSYISDCV